MNASERAAPDGPARDHLRRSSGRAMRRARRPKKPEPLWPPDSLPATPYSHEAGDELRRLASWRFPGDPLAQASFVQRYARYWLYAGGKTDDEARVLGITIAEAEHLRSSRREIVLENEKAARVAEEAQGARRASKIRSAQASDRATDYVMEAQALKQKNPRLRWTTVAKRVSDSDLGWRQVYRHLKDAGLTN